MDPEEQSRKDKQTYLRTEILERMYDAEQFVDYMGTLKENGETIRHIGEDLDNWTLEELKGAVAEFQRMNKPVSPEGVQDHTDTIIGNGQMGNIGGVILQDSDDEDYRYQPEIRTRDRGVTDPLHEEFIGRSSAGIDTKPLQNASYESESEKKRKALLAVALEAKKATIVQLK